MDEILAFLEENRTGFLATVDAEGRPHVRVVGLQRIQDGRLVYATAKTKPMYEQIKQHPLVELAASKPDFSLNLRVEGKAVLLDDPRAKQEVLEASPSLSRIYKSADNPVFTLFYIEPRRARFWSFTEDRVIDL